MTEQVKDRVRSAADVARGTADIVRAGLMALRKEMDTVEGEYNRLAKELERYRKIDSQEAMQFLKEPWCILPQGRDEWRVVIPKFAGVQVGWLERATDTYNIFRVDRFSQWVGGIPQDLRDELKLPTPFESNVTGNVLKTSARLPEHVKKHVAEQTKAGQYRIKMGHEFDIIAALIDEGSLPFTPRPVDEEDLRAINFRYRGDASGLRHYQTDAWNIFRKVGRVGIFWPWGAGKSVLSTYAIGSIKGRKLVVAPSTALVEHWTHEINTNLDLGLRSGPDAIDIITYNGAEKVKDRKYVLAIFDECHRLPANTFSRLSTVQAKYAIGLSATPYREDGRTPYVMALTGYPIGMDWTEFYRSGVITKPEVECRLVRDWPAKMKETEVEAESTKGRVIVFCDGIDRGRQLADRMGVPHVYGDTSNKLEKIRTNRVTVVSRVGDEGISLPDLKKVVEVDFLGGSRRQEGQRVGRLFHAKGQGEHIVLMTRDEFERFEGRFLALEEKGIKVNVVER